MILSHKHKFIFICNAKTGTTSIENSLRHLHEGEPYTFIAQGLFDKKHIPPTILKSCLPSEVWRTYFKFVFVRNPFDWIVSNWNFHFVLKFRRWMEMQASRKEGATAHRESTPEPAYLGRTLRELASIQTFSERDMAFLFEFFKRSYRVVPYSDGLYQVNFVMNPDGKQLVDFLGRYEQLERDYAAILERFELNLQLPHLNRTRIRDFRSYFTPESASMAAKLWAIDFEKLGYPPTLNAQ